MKKRLIIFALTEVPNSYNKIKLFLNDWKKEEVS
jgi:hypothetical protein